MAEDSTDNRAIEVRFFLEVPLYTLVAQLVEPAAHNGLVTGSSPVGRTSYVSIAVREGYRLSIGKGGFESR